MMQVQRYLRAFVKAIRLQLAGQTAALPFPRLQEWVKAGQALADAAQRSAAAAGLNEAAQKKLVLVIDRREISMFVVLAAVRHNLYEEYPLLMRSDIEHQLTTLYAINMNDQYRIARLLELPELQGSASYRDLLALKAHLESIPPSNAVS